MKTYTPAELRALADSRHTNPFFADQAKAAMHYAANVLEAADAAVTAERQRAEQGGAQDVIEATARKLYGAWTDNQSIHCNRFPGWSELDPAAKKMWLERAAILASTPSAVSGGGES